MAENTRFCSTCFNIAEQSPCSVCSDDSRDRSILCVVEEPLDVVAIDRTGDYRGLYHVLHGAISPVDGIGPDELRISELLARLDHEVVQEVLLATNPNLEGEATAMYLARLIQAPGIRVTRLARGLPVRRWSRPASNPVRLRLSLVTRGWSGRTMTLGHCIPWLPPDEEAASCNLNPPPHRCVPGLGETPPCA